MGQVAAGRGRAREKGGVRNIPRVGDSSWQPRATHTGCWKEAGLREGDDFRCGDAELQVSKASRWEVLYSSLEPGRASWAQGRSRDSFQWC